jgi:RNA polymerase sigma factor (TIGR02999 family)
LAAVRHGNLRGGRIKFSGVQILFILLSDLRIFQGRNFGHVTETKREDVTRLLTELTRGNAAAVDALLPLIYDELRSLASNYLRRERPDHTLQPTALVHEAYLRLVDQTRVNWQNRAHFFGVAAQMMRRILVDHARAHRAGKRGADFQKLSLDENIDKAVERSGELIALDEALRELAEIDEQKSRIIELRYFGGLSVEEIAEVLGVAPVTVKRHWRMAKAWLYGRMREERRDEG